MDNAEDKNVHIMKNAKPMQIVLSTKYPRDVVLENVQTLQTSSTVLVLMISKLQIKSWLSTEWVDIYLWD